MPFVQAVRTALPEADLLIIDDNSPDGTGSLAERAKIRASMCCTAQASRVLAGLISMGFPGHLRAITVMFSR